MCDQADVSDETGLSRLHISRLEKPYQQGNTWARATYSMPSGEQMLTYFSLNQLLTGTLLHSMLSATNKFKWNTFKDRSVYRLGEEFGLKGCIRLIDVNGYVHLPQTVLSHTSSSAAHTTDATEDGLAVEWTLKDQNEVVWHQGCVDVTENGSFAVKNRLPTEEDGAEHKPLTISFSLLIGGKPISGGYCGLSHSEELTVEEFETPNFEVSVRSSTPASGVLQGEHVNASMSAMYYTGGPISSSESCWEAEAQLMPQIPAFEQFVKQGYSHAPRWANEFFSDRIAARRLYDAFSFDRPAEQALDHLVTSTDSSGKAAIQAHIVAGSTSLPVELALNAVVGFTRLACHMMECTLIL